MTGLFKMMATSLFYLAKDGSYVYEFHRCMEAIDQEHLCFELLRKQLLAFRRIIFVLSHVLTIMQKESDHFDSQIEVVQSRQDLRSIILDARASIAVITGFFADVGQDYSLGSPNSPST